MKNTFCWMQMRATDTGKSKEFYANMFSWKMNTTPMPDDSSYIEFDAGDGPAGGIGETDDLDTPSSWLPFVQVSNIEAYTKKAEELGGKVIVPPTPIPDEGVYSVVLDPNGAEIGLYQPK